MRNTKLWRALERFVREEDGLETVEWAVVGTAVVLVAIVAFNLLGTETTTAINNIAEQIPPD